MYTVEEFAKIMRVTPLTVRRWIKAGKIKIVQFGKGSPVRISEEEVNRLKKGKVQ